MVKLESLVLGKASCNEEKIFKVEGDAYVRELCFPSRTCPGLTQIGH